MDLRIMNTDVWYTVVNALMYYTVDSIQLSNVYFTHTPDSRFTPSQWETALLYNDVYHWLGASLESAVLHNFVMIPKGNMLIAFLYLLNMFHKHCANVSLH